jgi:hypothetical protein
MKKELLALCVFLLTGFFATQVMAGADEPGWLNLIQGGKLDGREQHGGQAKYRVEDGQIVGSSTPNTPNSFLCTKRSFTNFVLELDFKVQAGLNSGVQIRSHVFERPTQLEHNGKTIKIPAGRVHGYQIEIDTTKRAWTGGLYDEGRRGWLNDLKDNAPARRAFKANEWNSFRIEARGPSIMTWINGVPAADYQDALSPSGFIALQVHGVGTKSDEMEVRFRGIRVKEFP